jgi:hypothetical protein
MKFIDLIKHEIVELQDYKTVQIELSLSREMGLTLSAFDEILIEQLDEETEGFKDLDGAVYFVIKTDLGTADRELMADFLISRFVPRIILDKIPEDRERRLGVPSGLMGTGLQYATMLDAVNRYDKITQFNIGISTKTGKNIIDVLGDE